MCAGYVCRLPEVIEAARARLHWDRGELLSFTGGEPPSDRLIAHVEILEGAVRDLNHWAATKKDE